MAAEKKKRGIPIKASDEVLGGTYANNMVVGHTREEFVMDFICVFASQGCLNARVITSPGHMKRIVRALNDNIRKYESLHGKIQEAREPVLEIREEDVN